MEFDLELVLEGKTNGRPTNPVNLSESAVIDVEVLIARRHISGSGRSHPRFSLQVLRVMQCLHRST